MTAVGQALARLEELAREVGRLEQLNDELRAENVALERAEGARAWARDALRDVRRQLGIVRERWNLLKAKATELGGPRGWAAGLEMLPPDERREYSLRSEEMLFLMHLERSTAAFVNGETTKGEPR